MTADMTHRERVLAAVNGQTVDRPPIALWRHFPVVDTTAEGLTQAVVDFQARYDFDMVKITPASGYPAEAWGAVLEDDANDHGTRRYVKRVVESARDWHTLEPLGADNPVLARELQATSAIRAAVGDDVHVLQTIFSPLTIAKQLYGPEILTHLRAHPADVADGLRAIAETTARFAADTLDHGADGVFFATQFARRDRTSAAEYKAFGLPYDRTVLDAVRPRAEIVLLHLCGPTPMFEVVPELRPHIVNWEDQSTPPSLREGWQAFPSGAVLGGLRRDGTLLHGTPEAVAADVRRAVAQTGGRRLIVGAGCVTLVDTPEESLAAARAAVEGG